MIFRITRDSDVEIQEESEDLVQSFELALKKRRTGDIVRLEILENSDEQLVNFIKDKLNVVNEYIYTVSGLVGIQDIDQLCRIKHSKDSFKPFKPREVERLKEHNNNFFETIKKATGENIEPPVQIKKYLDKEEKFDIIENNISKIKEYIHTKIK